VATIPRRVQARLGYRNMGTRWGGSIVAGAGGGTWALARGTWALRTGE